MNPRDEAVALGPNATFDDTGIGPVRLPDRVGRFAVEGELGRGRYGTVYAAVDPRDGRRVAVKRISGAVADDPLSRRRCLREAKLASRFDHPGIARVLSVEEVDFGLLLVMERAEGLDLQRVIALRPGRPLPHEWSVEVVRQVAEAVASGHVEGVVHRDLKPANIMVDPPPARIGEESFAAFTPEGRPRVTARVLDFGLAVSLDDELRLTRTSMMVGTPLYMAPEQAACDRDGIGAATDVFSLGAILYELLVGEPPFAAPTVTAILARLGDGDPRPPRKIDPRIPVGLEAVCLRCLRQEPGERYADAGELAADLERYANGGPVEAGRDGTVTRIRRWARRGRRTQAAGWVAACLIAAVTVWSLVMIGPLYYFNRSDPERLAQAWTSLWILLFVLTPLQAVCVYAAVRAGVGRMSPRLTAFAATVMGVFAVQQSGVAVGVIPPPLQIYIERPMMRVNIFVMLATLFASACAAFVIVWLGRPANKPR